MISPNFYSAILHFDKQAQVQTGDLKALCTEALNRANWYLKGIEQLEPSAINHPIRKNILSSTRTSLIFFVQGIHEIMGNPQNTWQVLNTSGNIAFQGVQTGPQLKEWIEEKLGNAYNSFRHLQQYSTATGM
jgi:hypothetical protein